MLRKMMDDDDDVYLYDGFHIPGPSSSSHLEEEKGKRGIPLCTLLDHLL